MRPLILIPVIVCAWARLALCRMSSVSKAIVLAKKLPVGTETMVMCNVVRVGTWYVIVIVITVILFEPERGNTLPKELRPSI